MVRGYQKGSGPVKRIWDFDRSSLQAAWIEYQSMPSADRSERFGQWFLNRYYIQGLMSWPGLWSEPDNFRAYDLLLNLVRE